MYSILAEALKHCLEPDMARMYKCIPLSLLDVTAPVCPAEFGKGYA